MKLEAKIKVLGLLAEAGPVGFDENPGALAKAIVDALVHAPEEGNEIEEAKARMLEAIPHFKTAVAMAKEEYPEVGFAIVGKKPSGEGKVMAHFECEAFFKDLSTILGHTTEPTKVDLAMGKLMGALGTENQVVSG